jgi:TolB-like protein
MPDDSNSCAFEQVVMGSFRLDQWLVHPALNTISSNGIAVRLEPKQMEVLMCLARTPAEPISKEKLLRSVWPDTFVGDDVLTRCISELRRAFKDDARVPRFIETIPKRGYRLVAPLARGESAIARQAARDFEVAASHRPKKRVAFSVLSGLTVLVVLALAGQARNRSEPSSPLIRSVAVLPFQNRSNDPSQDVYVDGLTDELISKLARAETVRVISRTSVMRFRKTDKSLPAIAHELNADAIIEGSVLCTGNRLRITSQLIYARNDSSLWSQTYDRDSQDVLAVQEGVADDVIREVRERLNRKWAGPVGSKVAINTR